MAAAIGLKPPDFGHRSHARRNFRRRQTPEEQDKLREPINWLNGSSRWVVIGSQSGRVVTVENAHVDLRFDLPNIYNKVAYHWPLRPKTCETNKSRVLASSRMK